MNAPRKTSVKKKRKLHILRWIVILLCALLLCALAGTFSVYKWVGDHIQTESDWLTSSVSADGTSWLILGSDERTEEESAQTGIVGYRTDSLLVLTKPTSGASSLVSIPRDSLVNVDDNLMKINAVAQLYGHSALVGAVEQITGISIDHVAIINFEGLREVVNSLGGVELCYDEDVQDAYSNLNWTAGCHIADGETALAFARMRYEDVRGDFGRAERQRQVIAAIMKKGLSRETLTSFSTLKAAASATLGAVSFDDATNQWTLLQMALAFRDATGVGGITGSVYWSDPNYYVDGVGSCVLLDEDLNHELFASLDKGSMETGSHVGTL